MFALSVFMRLFLSVALMLNGSASAIAAARLATAHSHHAMQTQATHDHRYRAAAEASQSPAHHAMQATAASAEHDIAMMSSPQHSKNASDHCEPEDCRSECMQHCAAAISTTTVQIAVIPRAGPMKLLQAGRLPPVLSHLHRPPIG